MKKGLPHFNSASKLTATVHSVGGSRALQADTSLAQLNPTSSYRFILIKGLIGPVILHLSDPDGTFGR